MKRDEKNKAIVLRKKGESIGDIATKLHVAKSSVSVWVRDVPLTLLQRKKLSRNGYSIDAIEKRRIKRITTTRQNHALIREAARKDIKLLSTRELWLIGIALYWGEGGKTKTGMARIANSDPAVIRFMMRFFREVCKVPEKKFRGHVHTFSHLNIQHAEEYWSDISGIPRKQFFKTYAKPSIVSKNKKDSLPNGTFQIYVCDTILFLTIMGWIDGVKEFGV